MQGCQPLFVAATTSLAVLTQQCAMPPQLLRELRAAGATIVSRLTELKQADRSHKFLWNGKDYMAKMATDVDFAAELMGPDAAGALILPQRGQHSSSSHPRMLLRCPPSPRTVCCTRPAVVGPKRLPPAA